MGEDSLYVDAICNADMRATASTYRLWSWYDAHTIEDMEKSYALHEKIREVKECGLPDVSGWL